MMESIRAVARALATTFGGIMIVTAVLSCMPGAKDPAMLSNMSGVCGVLMVLFLVLVLVCGTRRNED